MADTGELTILFAARRVSRGRIKKMANTNARDQRV